MRAAALALAFSVLAVGVAHGQGERPDAVARNNRGAELLGAGKTDEAIGLFREAVALDPGNVVAQANLAAALEKQGRLDEAIGAYQRVLERDPKNATARNNLGTVYSRKGLYADAAREFDTVLRQDPSNAIAKANLDNVRHNERVVRERDERIARVLAAADTRPSDPRAAYDVARTYAQLSDADNALVWLGKALDLGYDRAEFVRVDPSFATLRQDARFGDIVKAHGNGK